jgi:hypothetical protein
MNRVGFQRFKTSAGATWSAKNSSVYWAKLQPADDKAAIKIKRNQQLSRLTPDCSEVLHTRLSAKMFNEYERRMKNSFI